MSQKLVLKVKGLQTNQNQLSEITEGALALAKNINIDKDSVGEPRRGYDRIAYPPSSSARHDRVTSYQDHIISRRSDDDSLNYYVDGVGWTQYSGTYDHPDSSLAKMRFVKSSGNLYFTTSEGVKVLDIYTGPIYNTGSPQGLDGVASTTGSSGFMSDAVQVAYRIVFGSRDANNNLYLGAPSQRILAVNTSGGTRDVSLTFSLPDGVTTDDFFQVYRSKESTGSSVEANDELQLVYEKNPTSGEISAKSVTFTDSTPTSLMGASLYSNASQEGAKEANDEPPKAMDIALFKNFMFYANVSTKYRLAIKLLSVGGTSGIALNDTITINSLVYTAKAAENIAAREFLLSTGGSAAQNIDDTARSLIKVVNQHTSNTSIYAYYQSDYQDLPGQILFKNRTLAGTSFSVSVSVATSWDIGTGTSVNDTYINGLMWSKIQQNEHVPSSHLELVGSKNYPIRRIVALRDSLFILKSDGVFRLTGSNGTWSIDPLDTSTKIIAPDSAAVVNNQIFALTDQGIVSISDVGVQVISRPIENIIQDLISTNYTALKTVSLGISYDTDRKYLLSVITESGDTYGTQVLVYNTFTNAWTTWVKDINHAFVNESDDKIYICNPGDEHLLKERKSLTYTDYIDEEVDGFSVVSSSNYEVVLNTIANLDVGYLLYESSTVYSVITAIDTATSTVTVNDLKTWSVGAVTVYKSIPCEIEFASNPLDNAGIQKHFQECAFLFRENNFINGDASFFTDISGGYSNTPIYGAFGGGSWGLFSWGNIPWGGTSRPKPIRVFIPREKSRGEILSVKLKISNAYSKWSLNGISLSFEYVSERTTRS